MSGKPYLEQPELHTRAPYRASMLTYPGNLHQAFKDAQEDGGKALMGVAQGIPSVFVTKMIASLKPDFIWFDLQHSMWNRLELQDAIHAAQTHSEGHALVLVRVAKEDQVGLTTAVDAGAAGIIIPDCESAQEVQDFIKKARFAPRGHRSFSPWTFVPGLVTSLYPKDPYNIKTYDDHLAIIAQVESVKGIENVEEIAAVPGLSGFMFGPGDYTISAGLDAEAWVNGQPEPAFLEAMGKFHAAAAKNNLPVFGGVFSLDQIPMLLENGMRAICVEFDYWSFSKLIASSLKTGRDYAEEFGKTSKAKVPRR